MDIEKEIVNIKIKQAYEGGKSSENSKTIFRKLDNVLDNQRTHQEKMNDLPCRVHHERHKWLIRSDAGLWGLLLLLIAYIAFSGGK